ncbi:GNAT family N-acetyltransferase [Microvirga thermotolerans]|uniref:GNAT family N-acetyltransferase n=1 Tax=Microvirga thermotolerans TaxID=2651334 RepID=A0A5P9JSQ1_9HYPH|nr:GNAT family N-acetyltransferase [Microvirga thermotolerans]QFU15657.1 GNAT family N-acetyltransferase [Microvirga thermotolerans]
MRALEPADAEAYRALRLQALANAPEAFGASYEEEAGQTLDGIRARIGGHSANRIFGAWSSGRLVGMAGFAARERLKSRHKGIMWGVYVRPDWRGRGLGEALVRQVIDHAALHVVVLEAAVGLHNESARRTYHKLGFRPYGIERKALRVGNVFYDEELLFIDFSDAAR